MGDGVDALKDMAGQLAGMLQVQGERGREAWSELHGKLGQVAARVGSGDDPRTAVEALLKVARDASSSQALIRSLQERINDKSVLKDLVFLVAHELNMTPLSDSEPVHMVDRDKKFCDRNVELMIKSSAELSDPNAPYAAISIVGAQSSGKSYLLNRLFGTRFPEMDASRGWSRTTRGIMISRCIWPSLLVMDVEGFDGVENGQDTLFEKQAALFALTVSNLMIVNMPIGDICREQASGTILFSTIFKERTKIQDGGLTKILVVLRNYNGETPLVILRSDVVKKLKTIWESVNMTMEFNDYIEVDIFGMPDKESPKFQNEVTILRRQLSENVSAIVPASSFKTSSGIVWDIIKQNKKLDIPSHKELIAILYCQRLVEDTLNSLDSLEEYKVLKVEESPSRFKELACAIFECITTEYDRETKSYDHAIRSKQRQHMTEKLDKIFTDYAREIIWKMKDNTLEEFKGEFERNIQDAKSDVANSHGELIANACLKKFVSSCEDLNEFDSINVPRIYGQLKDDIHSHTIRRILEIKERERKEEERIRRTSLALQITDTVLRGGDVVVSACNFISGANGN